MLIKIDQIQLLLSLRQIGGWKEMRLLKHKWQKDLKHDKSNHITTSTRLGFLTLADMIGFSLLTANSWSTCVPSTDITISTLDIGKCIFSLNKTSLKYSKSIILKPGPIFTPGSNKALKANSFIRHNARLVDINVVLGVFHLNLLNLKSCWTFCFESNLFLEYSKMVIQMKTLIYCLSYVLVANIATIKPTRLKWIRNGK